LIAIFRLPLFLLRPFSSCPPTPLFYFLYMSYPLPLFSLSHPRASFTALTFSRILLNYLFIYFILICVQHHAVLTNTVEMSGEKQQAQLADLSRVAILKDRRDFQDQKEMIQNPELQKKLQQQELAAASSSLSSSSSSSSSWAQWDDSWLLQQAGLSSSSSNNNNSSSAASTNAQPKKPMTRMEERRMVMAAAKAGQGAAGGSGSGVGVRRPSIPPTIGINEGEQVVKFAKGRKQVMLEQQRAAAEAAGERKKFVGEGRGGGGGGGGRAFVPVEEATTTTNSGGCGDTGGGEDDAMFQNFGRHRSSLTAGGSGVGSGGGGTYIGSGGGCGVSGGVKAPPQRQKSRDGNAPSHSSLPPHLRSMSPEEAQRQLGASSSSSSSSSESKAQGDSEWTFSIAGESPQFWKSVNESMVDTFAGGNNASSTSSSSSSATPPLPPRQLRKLAQQSEPNTVL
jgi:hypothetical protein